MRRGKETLPRSPKVAGNREDEQNGQTAYEQPSSMVRAQNSQATNNARCIRCIRFVRSPAGVVHKPLVGIGQLALCAVASISRFQVETPPRLKLAVLILLCKV